MAMPSKGTPKITLRIEPDLWDAFGAVCEITGATRTELLRAWIRAYIDEHTATGTSEQERDETGDVYGP